MVGPRTDVRARTHPSRRATIFFSAAGRLIFLIAINRENRTINFFSAMSSYVNKNVEKFNFNEQQRPNGHSKLKQVRVERTVN